MKTMEANRSLLIALPESRRLLAHGNFSRRLAWGLALAALVVSVSAGFGQSRKILFFDDEDVFYRSGIKRNLHQLVKRGQTVSGSGVISGTGIPVIVRTAPAETPMALSVCSATYDPTASSGNKYKVWYQIRSGTGAYDTILSYAKSEDGITSWTKPATGYTVPGYSGANAVLAASVANSLSERWGASVIYDDAAGQYKMVYTDWQSSTWADGVGLRLATSSSGTSWTGAGSPAVVQKIAYDHRNALPPLVGDNPYVSVGPHWNIPMSMGNTVDLFRDPATSKYVIYGEISLDGPTGAMDDRSGMGRIEAPSSDFTSWSDPAVVLFPDEKDLLTNDSDPNNDVDISFQGCPAFYYGGGMYLSFNQLLNRGTGTSDIELMSSRDGTHWTRFHPADYDDVSILPRGAIVGGVYQEFDSRYIYTNATPILTSGTFRVYYGGYGNKSAIGLATVQEDRLVGLQSVWSNTTSSVPAPKVIAPVGQVTLKAIDLAPYSKLTINATTGTGGEIRVDILTSDGYRLAGFTSTDCAGMTSASDRAFEIKWGVAGIRALADLPPSPVASSTKNFMIRFQLKNAELYSCSLVP